MLDENFQVVSPKPLFPFIHPSDELMSFIAHRSETVLDKPLNALEIYALSGMLTALRTDIFLSDWGGETQWIDSILIEMEKIV